MGSGPNMHDVHIRFSLPLLLSFQDLNDIEKNHQDQTYGTEYSPRSIYLAQPLLSDASVLGRDFFLQSVHP